MSSWLDVRTKEHDKASILNELPRQTAAVGAWSSGLFDPCGTGKPIARPVPNDWEAGWGREEDQ